MRSTWVGRPATRWAISRPVLAPPHMPRWPWPKASQALARRGARPITYKGRTYAGVADMMRRLKMGKGLLYKLLDSGEAKR